MSYFEARVPTDQDIDSLPRIYLTAPDTWDPYDPSMSERESHILPHIELVVSQGVMDKENGDPNVRVLSTVLVYDSVFSQPLRPQGEDLYEQLVAQVYVLPENIEGDGMLGCLQGDVYPDAEGNGMSGRLQGDVYPDGRH